jgi:hypothetical protein
VTQYDLTGVQRVRAAVESSMGTDMTSDIATNFFDLRVCEHTEIMRKTVVGEDATVVQRPMQQNPVVVSEIDRWDASVKCYWQASGVALNSAASPTQIGQNKFLEVVLGGYYAAAGSDVVASPSPTTTSFSVTTGHGSRFREGQLIGILSGSTVSLRLVTAISTDALTIWPALSGAPSTGDDVLNGQILYPTDAPSGSLNLLVEKAIDRNDIYLGMGAQGTFALDMKRGDLMSWTVALTGSTSKHDDEFTTPLTSGSTITAATFTGSAPLHSMNGLLHFGTAAGTTLTSIRDASMTVNFNLANLEVDQMSGSDGIGQWQRNTRPPMTIELTIPGPHETYHDAFLASTLYGVLAQFGSSSTTVRGFCAPTLQIVAPPEPVDINGMRGTKLSLRMLENGHSSDKATEIKRAPFTLFT